MMDGLVSSQRTDRWHCCWENGWMTCKGEVEKVGECILYCLGGW